MTSQKLVKQAPASLKSSDRRQNGGCIVGPVEAGEHLQSKKEGECSPSQETLQPRPIYTDSNDGEIV